ncbi:thioredoxin domain-containing protein [Microbacterium sp. YY-01]|uniref:thioredoxin domain-containing protein n=1 Tax=Microbacterium sp. YY-01 TaxID=3421634 RepID=UPI003D16B619
MSNRLAATLSPYLQAHADNPVDWWPWGSEAFHEAERRGVPLFISIGYSTCHWCHVMARESFADPETAAHINANFVAIKIDREEHPEVDAAYMAAASAFTSHLGWPLTIFATPQGQTFYAGTYFPPAARPPLPAFRDVLTAVVEAWRDRHDEVQHSAGAVADALRQAAVLPDATDWGTQHLVDAARTIAAREDHLYGGFGGAPKFPVATTLAYLCTTLIREHSPQAAASARRALAAMAASELRDPEDGGFFRYATQRDWTVPHYERMLNDNAQLLEIATVQGDAETAEGIAHFLGTVLQQPGGGFGAAQDSESWIDGERREGEYYRRRGAERHGLAAPAVDAKVLTAWNALAIRALAEAGVRLHRPGWITSARRAAEAVLRDNRDSNGNLVRSSLDGRSATAAATLADYALLADALLTLAVASGDAVYAQQGLELLGQAEQHAESTTVHDPVLTEHGISPSPDHSDGDLPSGPSALAQAYVRAWQYGAGEHYRQRAESIVARHIGPALHQPFAHGAMLSAAAALATAPRQVVVITHQPAAPLAQAARTLHAEVIAVVTAEQASALAHSGFELFADKTQPAAYDCSNFVCSLPTTDPHDLRDE